MSVPTELREPEYITDPRMLPEEIRYHAAVEDTPSGMLTGAAAIGAAFFGYRWYMRRRLKEEMKGKPPTSRALRKAVDVVFTDYQATFVRTIMPHLVSGYADGLVDVATGTVPDEVLHQVAYSYAYRLGEHLNDVSAEAVVSGYQAQLNRKVPPARALQRVLDAFGVPPRTMNSLVNMWTADEPKIQSSVVPTDRKKAQGQLMIEQALSNRARTTGDNEMWSARSQAKQVVWMYAKEKGAIPSTATRHWVTADDERVCPSCGPMDGVRAELGSRFQVAGYGKVWAPPLHPNCRCDVVLDVDIDQEIMNLVERSREPVRKDVRRVDTPEGAAYFNQPIGSVIQRAQDRPGRQSPGQATQQAAPRRSAPQQPQRTAYQSPIDEVMGTLQMIEQGLTAGTMTPEQINAAQEYLDWLDSTQEKQEQRQAPARLRDRSTGTLKDRGTRSAKLSDRSSVTLKDREVLRDRSALQERTTLQDRSTGALRDRSTITSAEQARQNALKDKSETKQKKKPTGASRTPEIIRTEKPMYAYVSPEQVHPERNRLGRPVVRTSDADRWTYAYGHDTTRTVSAQVDAHWTRVENDQLDEFYLRYTDPGTNTIFLDDLTQGGEAVLVYRDEFTALWRWYLRGGGSTSWETIELPVETGGPGLAYEEFSFYDIASYFDFEGFMEDHIPNIITTEYVDNANQDYHWSKEGFATVDGRWKVEAQYEHKIRDDGTINGVPGINLPHRVLDVTPEWMDEEP